MKRPYTEEEKTECKERARAFRLWAKRRGFTYFEIATKLGVQPGLVESWSYKGPKVLELNRQRIAEHFTDCPLINTTPKTTKK